MNLREQRVRTGIILSWVLTNYGKSTWVTIDGKRVKLVTGGKKRKRGKQRVAGGRPRKYHDGCIVSLTKIRDFFDRPCGEQLVPFIRNTIDFLETSRDPDFGFPSDIRQLQLEISDSHADRLLQPAKKRLALQGKRCTTQGLLLKSQISVRTFFAWDERKPGFFEIDRLAHCGISTKGAHCWRVTAPDIYSGWTKAASPPQ